MNSKLVIVVPLRLASVRVPEKILADIGGASLSQRTVGRVLAFAKGKSDVVVCAAVDDLRTMAHLKERHPELDVVLTKPELTSGTDRVNSAYEFLVNKKGLKNVRAVVNLQGDMPFFSHAILESAHKYFNAHPSFEGVWTAGHPFENLDDVKAISCVKALKSQSGRAVYFSRYPIPYSRVEPKLDNAVLCHIGIYAYHPKALSKFCHAKPSAWEQNESLEQLRALDLDIPFVIDEVPAPGSKDSYRGIDIPEDLAWAKEFAL